MIYLVTFSAISFIKSHAKGNVFNVKEKNNPGVCDITSVYVYYVKCSPRVYYNGCLLAERDFFKGMVYNKLAQICMIGCNNGVR